MNWNTAIRPMDIARAACAFAALPVLACNTVPTQIGAAGGAGGSNGGGSAGRAMAAQAVRPARTTPRAS
jgi:hypothetical protein